MLLLLCALSLIVRERAGFSYALHQKKKVIHYGVPYFLPCLLLSLLALLLPSFLLF